MSHPRATIPSRLPAAPSGRRNKATAEQREAARLRRIFAPALLAALGVGALAFPFACSSEQVTTSSTGPGGGGSTTLPSTGGSTTSTAAGTTSETLTGTEPIADGGVPEASPCDPQEFEPDPPDNCGVYYRLPCGLDPAVMPANNCYLTPNDCLPICGRLAFNCHAVGASCVDGGVVNDADGGIDIDCATCAGGLGRVPQGLEHPVPRRAGTALGTYFARAAHLEAASVIAFRRLREELDAHRAPASLLRAAERAERDEVRHTGVCTALSRRFGGEPARAFAPAVPIRSLEEIAVENAVEGCVRETFGAAIAHFQARRATDSAVASALRSIARDETFHAALSWSVLRWSTPRLDPRARARLRERCREAVTALRTEADTPVPREVESVAGVPGPRQQLTLLAALERTLWRELAAG